jgi:hypothetical protein
MNTCRILLLHVSRREKAVSCCSINNKFNLLIWTTSIPRYRVCKGHYFPKRNPSWTRTRSSICMWYRLNRASKRKTTRGTSSISSGPFNRRTWRRRSPPAFRRRSSWTTWNSPTARSKYDHSSTLEQKESNLSHARRPGILDRPSPVDSKQHQSAPPQEPTTGSRNHCEFKLQPETRWAENKRRGFLLSILHSLETQTSSNKI